MVEVTGEGVVKVEPDEVNLRVGVEFTGEDPAALKRLTDQVIAEVLGLLKREGVDKKHVQTDYIRMDKSYDYQTKKNKFYARQQITIQLKELEKYEGVMNGLLGSGINRIESVSFGSSKIEQLQSDARDLAMSNAKAKATQYADAIGQEIGKAIYIREQARSNAPLPVLRSAMTMDEAGSSQGNTLAPGEIEVRATVFVGFQLY
jgi:uncharacterized protein YggE